jgi:hypothetical protein
MRRFLLGYALLVSTALVVAARNPTVDLELVLALDGSSSVDIGEYALQLRGIAQSFRDPVVQAAIRNGPEGRIAVSALVWAQPGYPKQSTGWFTIANADDAEAFARRIEALPRKQFGGTGIGEGVEVSLRELADNQIEATRQVIDVSGDGRETWFAVATQLPVARGLARAQGVVINGLAISNDDPGLFEYYDTSLRTGPNSFAMEAPDFLSFAEAMKVKLLREIAGQSIASAEPLETP